MIKNYLDVIHGMKEEMEFTELFCRHTENLNGKL